MASNRQYAIPTKSISEEASIENNRRALRKQQSPCDVFERLENYGLGTTAASYDSLLYYNIWLFDSETALEISAVAAAAS